MLVINAPKEQRQVFNSLIQEMDIQVVWSGRFVIMGDRLILEGMIRSLFFHLDIQKTGIDFIELPTENEEELELSDYPGISDLITMIIYAFEKFGILNCVVVNQDIGQLEQLFQDILSDFQLEVAFSEEKIEFYQSGMRITYEDVIEQALAFPEASRRIPRLELPAVSSYEEANQNPSQNVNQETPVKERDSRVVDGIIAKYHARIGVLDRLSDMQKKALVRDIRFDKVLNDAEKEKLYDPIQDYELQEHMNAIEKELTDSSNRNYAHLQKMIQRVEKEELFEKTKEAVIVKLQELRQQFGMQEVREIMEKAPQHVERTEYQELREKLAPYQDIDLSEYQKRLDKMRETLEIKEISNMLMQSPKNNRKDYMELLRCIEEQDFAPQNAAPYIERILDWVSELDKEKLQVLLVGTESMDLDQAASVYDRIRKDSFLPKLKESALAIISKRLQEIRLTECRQYVYMLEKSMDGVIKQNPRHHFYPAEKILLRAGMPQELKLIDRAVRTYAERKSPFEYPILMADTSKECNGRDGMLLTPEHLFYSTRLNGYCVSIAAIKSISVSSGLLNHKSLMVEEKNGVKHKLPYVVEAEEMKEWAKILELFVRYLQKRPICEALTYEVLEDEGMTSCRRCGCVYQDSEICPECGCHKK